jgi:hypothetical protein
VAGQLVGRADAHLFEWELPGDELTETVVTPSATEALTRISPVCARPPKPQKDMVR